MRPEPQKKFSVLILGPAGAGKTAFLGNLRGESENHNLSPTMGLSYCFCDDQSQAVRGIFSDVSGEKRFFFLRKMLIQQKKDCFIIIVDDLSTDGTLQSIENTLAEIWGVYSVKNHPPMGLIINHKVNSRANFEIIHSVIAEKYEGLFHFVTHCSVTDKNYRDRLFCQVAKIANVPLFQSDVTKTEWGSWFYETSISVMAYLNSFFQQKSAVLAITDKKPEPAVSPACVENATQKS